ncbi:MAG: TRAP transporter substrate-binding protein [Mailhella sp.]|nr:TRAP transporter substrate-binding protein [Mailhella sp.]
MKSLFGILAIALALSFGNAYAAPQVLKVAVGDPEDSEQGIAAKTFKQYVESKSNGKYDVQLFFSGQLGDETETIHNVRRGTLDLSCVGIANIVPFVKKLGVLTLPYLFDNIDEVVKGTTGASHELLNSYAVKEGGFRVLCWTYTDFRWITNSKRPIKSMADIKGLKFRVPQSAVLLASYKAFGANPVPISWAETFTALQQGVVDGQCYGYIGIQAMKFMEANQKYLTEVHYTYQLQPLIMSQRVFKKMSADDQKLMLDAGMAAQEAVLKYQNMKGSQAKQELIAAGLVVDQLTDEPAWKEAAMSKVWPEMADFCGGKDAINAYLKTFGKAEWK